MKSKMNKRREGFSLVEVALAMMVLAVGLMAVFMIFPTGLQFGRESTERSYGALFAEDVSSGIRASSLNLTGLEYWQIRDGFNMPATAYHVWDSPEAVQIKGGLVNHVEYTPDGVTDRAMTEVQYGYALERHVPKGNVGWFMDVEVRLFSPPIVASTGKTLEQLEDSEQTVYYWTTIMMPDLERLR